MPEPALSDEFTVAALDTEVRRDLRGLQKDTADSVARHLVAAGSLVEEDPQLALEHARYARRRASRIAVVREAAGITAYHAGEWAEALAELRAARRMGGGPVHLPVMADIERALGRPERAVDIARGPEAAELGTAERIELAIVGAGARRDLGELDAAVVGLQIPELDPVRRDPWSARLFYAYADNLLAAGRESDALQWFAHAVDADVDGATDADARIAELTGEELPDDSDDFEFGEEELAELVGSSDAQASSPVAEVPVAEVPVAEVPVAEAQPVMSDAQAPEPVAGEFAAGEPVAHDPVDEAQPVTGTETEMETADESVGAGGGGSADVAAEPLADQTDATTQGEVADVEAADVAIADEVSTDLAVAVDNPAGGEAGDGSTDGPGDPDGGDGVDGEVAADAAATVPAPATTGDDEQR